MPRVGRFLKMGRYQVRVNRTCEIVTANASGIVGRPNPLHLPRLGRTRRRTPIATALRFAFGLWTCLNASHAGASLRRPADYRSDHWDNGHPAHCSGQKSFLRQRARCVYKLKKLNGG